MTVQHPSLRVALIGYGFAGSVFHAPLISSVEGMQIAAVVAKSAEQRDRVRTTFPDAAALEDAELVFADTDGYDLVVVCTPNDSHAPLVRGAVKAGLPVVVDKPMASSAAEAADLITLAAEAAVPLTVFQNRRFDAEIRTLRALLGSEDIGRAVRFDSRYGFFQPEVSGGWREQADPALAPGVLYDLGAHVVDQALNLFGPARSVYAELGRLREGAQVPDDYFAAVRHESGAVSHLSGSLVSSSVQPRLAVEGLRGSITIEATDIQEDQALAGLSATDPAYGIVPDATATVRTLGADGALHTRDVPLLPGRHREFYVRLRDALRGEGELPVDPRTSLATMRVLDAAQLSATTGTVVELTQGGAA